MQKEMPLWLALAIFGFVGSVFLVAGIVMQRSHHKLDKLCDDEVAAVVAEMAVHEDSDGDLTYAPVYEYTYKGEFYRITSNTYSNPPLYHAGDQTTLRIRSDAPDQYLDPKQKPLVGTVFTILGGAFVLFSLGSGVVYLRSLKKLRIEN